MALRRDSYIDTSFIYTLSPEELGAALEDQNRHKGALLPAVRERIKQCVGSHDFLKSTHRDAILNNL